MQYRNRSKTEHKTKTSKRRIFIDIVAKESKQQDKPVYLFI